MTPRVEQSRNVNFYSSIGAAGKAADNSADIDIFGADKEKKPGDVDKQLLEDKIKYIQQQLRSFDIPEDIVAELGVDQSTVEKLRNNPEKLETIMTSDNFKVACTKYAKVKLEVEDKEFEGKYRFPAVPLDDEDEYAETSPEQQKELDEFTAELDALYAKERQAQKEMLKVVFAQLK